jgi:hypothetical protein
MDPCNRRKEWSWPEAQGSVHRGLCLLFFKKAAVELSHVGAGSWGMWLCTPSCPTAPCHMPRALATVVQAASGTFGGVRTERQPGRSDGSGPPPRLTHPEVVPPFIL